MLRVALACGIRCVWYGSCDACLRNACLRNADRQWMRELEPRAAAPSTPRHTGFISGCYAYGITLEKGRRGIELFR